jgi:hypothetical protein
VIKAEHNLPGPEGERREKMEEWAGRGEITEIMYALVNKKIKI